MLEVIRKPPLVLVILDQRFVGHARLVPCRPESMAVAAATRMARQAQSETHTLRLLNESV